MRFLLTASALAAVVAAVATPFEVELDERVTCPPNGTLAKPYENPSLIVQVSKKNPDKKYGPTKHPKITPNDLCAAINLSLPPKAFGMVCRLSFKIPLKTETPSTYDYAGKGHFQFQGYLSGFGADENTTYNNQPLPGPSPTAPDNISPGHSYTLLQAPCLIPPSLTPVTVGGLLCSNDTSFDWVNSDSPCPLGFFVELLQLNLENLGL